MSLTPEQIDALCRGTFDLSPVFCTLQQNATEDPEIVSGSGMVRQRPEDGVLELTLLSAEVRLGLVRQHPIGKLLPPDAYYTLTIEGPDGLEWRSPSVLPSFSFRLGRQRSATIAKVLIGQLETGREIPERAEQALELHVFGDVRIEATEHSSINIVEGGFRTQKNPRNVARSTAAGIQLEVTRWESRSRMYCLSSNAIPPGLEQGLVGALQLITAQPLRAAVSLHRANGRELVTIDSRGLRAERNRGYPPIPHEYIHSGELTWQLFAKYLEFVLADSPGARAISATWDGVVRAMGGTIDTQALVNTVAVDGILSQLDLKPLRNLPPRKRKADTRLKILAGAGVIDGELIPAWRRLRHPVAHGAKLGRGNWQQDISDNDAVLCLLYQLMFAAVGYRGFYRHYGGKQWSNQQYPPPRPPKQKK